MQILIILILLFSPALLFAQDIDYFNKAKYHYNLGDFTSAVEYFDRYLEQQTDSKTYYLKGYSLYKLGKFHEALDSFIEAYRINPNVSMKESHASFRHTHKPSKEKHPPQASLSNIKKSLLKVLPNYWDIVTLEVKSEKNIGSQNKPKFRLLIHLDLMAKKNLYDEAKWTEDDDKKTITHVSLSQKKGGRESIVATSISEKIENRWETTSEIDPFTRSFKIPGKPLRMFKGKPEVID